MTDVRARLEAFGYRRLAFTLVAVAFLVFFLGVMGAWRLLAWVVAAWFDGGLGLYDEYARFAPHLVHEVGFAVVLWAAVVGMVAQLRSPERNLSSQWLALLPFGAMLVAFAVTDFWRPLPMVGMVGAFVLVAALLHPAGRGLVTAFDPGNASAMLALLVVAAVPIVAFSVTQVGLQTGSIAQDSHDHDHAGGADRDVHEEHVEAGHFTSMVAFGLTVLGAGLLASLRGPGWWVPAWFTGFGVAIFGAVSVQNPEMASSAGTVWGLAAVAWGLAFVAAAELTQDDDAPSLIGELRTTGLEG